MRLPDPLSFRFRYLHVWILASVAGAGGSILLAALLVPARDWLGNTNVALLLVGVVIAAAAVGGRLAGLVTALAASLAFNAMHTLPYGTLVIEHREDAITTALVAIVGITVGELTHRRIMSARGERIPESGVDVVVHRDGEPIGHLVLFPGPGLRVTHAGLVVAVVMAEMLGALLSRSYVPPT